MNRLNVHQIAREFWTLAGEIEPFPRSLEPALFWALPLGVFKLPRLSISDVHLWLLEQDVRVELGTNNRSLHGCLIANKGRGCVLLNGTDEEPELRFSLAHEISHFMLDYHLPRLAAVERFGPQILEVFDGVRPPTIEERVHSVLEEVPIGFHTHLMERSENGAIGCVRVGISEEIADSLALELLAPEQEARQMIAQARHCKDGDTFNDVASGVLVKYFGLPEPVATSYGIRLCRKARPVSIRQWLKQRR